MTVVLAESPETGSADKLVFSCNNTSLTKENKTDTSLIACDRASGRIRHIRAAIPESNLDITRLRVRRPETSMSTSTKGQGWRGPTLRLR